jgi:chromosome segregation protein
MRLSTIKLSGFKSFVDPTVLHLPTNMTGVVGPNGCGKSNIIDAVRWVMGESSASRLRGDSLTDVIFSGSSSRKPVSQATVELVFDNSEGQIGGEYARFAEISVKRTVSRDNQSNYYLNGAKCRRRDITDLFLGTGLGARSYSIIEQGMISQIIEARPEDLRVYLEEAAGISKYKERRKETETRIKHTRENLDRLTDLREEVDKQLDHLKRQARAAEQYQALQADRLHKDGQLRGLEWRRLHAQAAALHETLTAEETELQRLLADQRAAEAQIEACRAQQGEAGERLSKVQGEGYKVGGELARIEQQIQHQRELRQRLETARAEADAAFAQIGEHITGDERALGELRGAIAEAEPRLEALRTEDAGRQDELKAGRGRARRLAAALGRLRAQPGRGGALGRGRAHQDRIPREAVARRRAPARGAGERTQRPGHRRARRGDRGHGRRARREEGRPRRARRDAGGTQGRARGAAGAAARAAGGAVGDAQAGAGRALAASARSRRCSTPRSARRRTSRSSGCEARASTATRAWGGARGRGRLGNRGRDRLSAALLEAVTVELAVRLGRRARHPRPGPRGAGVVGVRRPSMFAADSLAAKVPRPGGGAAPARRHRRGRGTPSRRAERLDTLGDGRSLIPRRGEWLGNGLAAAPCAAARRSRARSRASRRSSSLRARDRDAGQARGRAQPLPLNGIAATACSRPSSTARTRSARCT